jgi:predicted amidohydrolase
MDRFINVAGGQLGPIARDESRQQVVSRLLELMREAKARGSDIVVFPELALTSFFPRWWMEDEAEIDSFFEREMPGPATRPLFEAAKSLGIGFHLGYAELAQQNGVARRYNTAILVDKNAAIVGKYRKVHLPGHADNRPHYPFQHLEKRYFEPGDSLAGDLSRHGNANRRADRAGLQHADASSVGAGLRSLGGLP